MQKKPIAFGRSSQAKNESNKSGFAAGAPSPRIAAQRWAVSSFQILNLPAFLLSGFDFLVADSIDRLTFDYYEE